MGESMNQNNDNQNTNNGFQNMNSNYQPLGSLNPSMFVNNLVQQNQPNNLTNNVEENNNKKSNKKPIIIIASALVLIAVIVSIFLEFNNNDNNNSFSDKKILVAYYSKDGENYGFNLSEKENLDKGNTEVMAEKIANYLDADLYEIIPSIAYPTDLDELYIQTKKELIDDYYPEIRNYIDVREYDIVFIGYPIWHQSYPQIIKTFVKNNPALKDKIIVPFNTHAGAGNSGTYKKLNGLIGNDSSKFLEGLNLNGTKVSSSDDKIKEWLVGIGFEIK